MRELIKIFQNIFQKKDSSPSILFDKEIFVLTPLDAMKLIYKDYRARKSNQKYSASQNIIEDFLQRAKLMIYFFRAFTMIPIVAFKGNLISVPLDLCTNQYAFSYGNNGWHWNIDLAKQVMSRPDVPVEETGYYSFFQNINCSSYTELMTFHSTGLKQSLPKMPFGSFPWGHFDRKIVIDPCKFYDRSKDLLVWYETGSKINDNFIKEFYKTVALLKSIKLNGYNLSFSKYQFPTVVILKNNKGKVCFLNVDGAHRFAILSALGYDRIVVTLYPNRYPPILEKDIENWPYVRSGLISRTDASKLFQLYFILNGRERTNS